MAKKRNRITPEMSKTIAASSPLIKSAKPQFLEGEGDAIIEVPLSSLKQNPYQPRIDINLQSLNELISSIEQNGLLQPIVVAKNGDESYTIVAGHRRCEAFKIMGKEKIKATVLKDVEEKDLAILSLTENLMRENLHPIENAIAIKNILDNGLVESQNKLAEYVGLSKGYVSKLMNILKLPSSVIKIVKEENYKDINILVLINKLQDEEQMIQAYNAVKHMPRSEAEAYLKEQYFKKEKQESSRVELKKTATKITLQINTKKLKKEQIDQIQKRVEALNKELDDILDA